MKETSLPHARPDESRAWTSDPAPSPGERGSSPPNLQLGREYDAERHMRQLLGTASLHLSNFGLGIHAYSVIAPPGHPLHKYHLGIDTPAQAAALIEEAPAHLACPNIWTVITQLKPSGGAAWASGYMAVRSVLMPRKGSFRSHSDLSVYKIPCPYTDETERQAFFSGCRYYLKTFQQALRGIRDRKAEVAAQTAAVSPEQTGTHPD